MKLSVMLGVTGLILDIMGAWFISNGLIRKTFQEINDEAPGFGWSKNEAYMIGALTQKIEATVGFYVLSSGFTFQLLAYLVNYLAGYISTIVSSLLVTGLLGVWTVSNYIIKRKINFAKKKLLVEQLTKNGYSSEKPMHVEDTKRYLRYLKVGYNENVTIEQAWPLLIKTLDF